MATNTRNRMSVYTTTDISASELTDNNTFIPAFKPSASNYKVPVSSFYGTFQTTSGMTAYYDKTEVYNKTEVDSMIADFGGYEVVELVNDEPDVATPDTKTIYLTKDDSITGDDSYKEWIWKAADPQDPQSTSAWDLIGDTSLDLSDYLTHNDIPSIDIASGNTVYSASNVMMYYKYPTTATKNIAIAFSGMPGEDSSATSGFLVPEPDGQHKILATSMSNTLSMYWIEHPIPRFNLDKANNVLTVDSDGLTYDWKPLTKTRVEIDVGPDSDINNVDIYGLFVESNFQYEFLAGTDGYNYLNEILDEIDTIYNAGLTPSITFIGKHNVSSQIKTETTLQVFQKQCAGYIFIIPACTQGSQSPYSLLPNGSIKFLYFGPHNGTQGLTIQLTNNNVNLWY